MFAALPQSVVHKSHTQEDPGSIIDLTSSIMRYYIVIIAPVWRLAGVMLQTRQQLPSQFLFIVDNNPATTFDAKYYLQLT
jgi:hypothetical protein